MAETFKLRIDFTNCPDWDVVVPNCLEILLFVGWKNGFVDLGWLKIWNLHSCKLTWPWKIHHFDGIYQQRGDFQGRTVSFREGTWISAARCLLKWWQAHGWRFFGLCGSIRRGERFLEWKIWTCGDDFGRFFLSSCMNYVVVSRNWKVHPFHHTYKLVGGGNSMIFVYSSLFRGRCTQFDEYFWDGLKPPTRWKFIGWWFWMMILVWNSWLILEWLVDDDEF